MLSEIPLHYVVRNEFGNLILVNNNILETRQHSAVNSVSSEGKRAGLGSPSLCGLKGSSVVASAPSPSSQFPEASPAPTAVQM